MVGARHDGGCKASEQLVWSYARCHGACYCPAPNVIRLACSRAPSARALTRTRFRPSAIGPSTPASRVSLCLCCAQAQVQQAVGTGAFAAPGAGNNLGGGMGVLPVPAMRGSVTSDTAVGPPSALDGGAGGGYGGGGGGGGNPNLPSVTSPAPLFELGAPVRAPPPMPPMPALAGDNMYVPAAGGGGGGGGGGS